MRSLDDLDVHGKRVLRIFEDLRQRLDLPFEQPSGRTRQQVRDALRARVRTVGHAERIVDVEVRQRRQRSRELGIVACLTRLESHVLQHQDVPLLELLCQRRHLIADHRRGQRHLRAGQLAQAIGHRRQ